jgi:hypothetical protein
MDILEYLMVSTMVVAGIGCVWTGVAYFVRFEVFFITNQTTLLTKFSAFCIPGASLHIMVEPMEIMASLDRPTHRGWLAIHSIGGESTPFDLPSLHTTPPTEKEASPASRPSISSNGRRSKNEPEIH